MDKVLRMLPEKVIARRAGPRSRLCPHSYITTTIREVGVRLVCIHCSRTLVEKYKK